MRKGVLQDMSDLEEKKQEEQERDVEALIALLDGYSLSGGSRMKIDVVEGAGEIVDRKYHHGRCDIASPWAKGQAFDVLE